MRKAFSAYSEAVKDGSFPAAEHEFKISDEVMEEVIKAEGGELS